MHTLHSASAYMYSFYANIYLHICTWEAYHGGNRHPERARIVILCIQIYAQVITQNWNYKRTKGFNQLFQVPGCLKNFDHPGGRETSVLGKLVPLEKGAMSRPVNATWETLWFKSGLLFTCCFKLGCFFLKCFCIPEDHLRVLFCFYRKLKHLSSW